MKTSAIAPPRLTTRMTSALSQLLAFVALLLCALSPQQAAAQENRVCPPDCGPFGNCVTCGFGDECTGEFCRCEAGYEGDDCSLKVEICPFVDAPSSVPSCRNGGRCVAKEIMENPEGFGAAQEVWRCDCSTAIGSALNPVQHEGAQCEFPATQSCLAGGIDSDYAFCVNGGDCVRKIIRGEEHPGCVNCGDYEGRHCQYKKGEAPPEELLAARKDIQEEENGMKPGLIVLLVMVACLVLGSFTIFIARRGASRDENTQAAVEHASSDIPNDLKLEEKSGDAGNEDAVQATTHDSGEDDEEGKDEQPQVV